MRAVLDSNVLISAVISRLGVPSLLISRWRDGDYDLIVSPLLLGELSRALAYPKLRRRVAAVDAGEYIELFRQRASVRPDPRTAARRVPDPADDYLLALAESERAVLVSGDQHLLGLAAAFPIFPPKEFLHTLEAES